MSTTISSNRPGGGIKWRWPSVHPEGRKFLLIAGIVTLCFWLLGWEILGWLMLGAMWGFAAATYEYKTRSMATRGNAGSSPP